MTTEEGNDIIAKYCGWKWESAEWDMMYKIQDGYWYSEDDELEDCPIEIYRECWDVLIPVVSKVCKELQEIPKAAGIIWDDDIHGECHAQQVAVEMAVLTWNITEVWSAVVKAINMINSIKNERESK